jgi:sporulation protein YlmC with PRC-barrel domain
MSIGKYFNRGVMALDAPHIGHVVKETDHNLVIFGDNDQRYDIPKSKIKEVGSNVILNMDIDEFTTYKMNNLTVLPK